MRLVEIQDEMHRLVDDAQRELDDIKRSIAETPGAAPSPSKALPPIEPAQPAPADNAISLQQRLRLIASS